MALLLGELELLCRWHARAVASSEGARAPGGAAADFAQVAEEGEGGGVAERDIDDAVVGEGAHGGDGGGFLTAAHGAGADEQAGVFAPEAAALPEAAGRVPECLPLGGEVAVAGGDAEEEGVVGLEDGRGDGGVVGLGWSVHLGQDFLREGLANSGWLPSVMLHQGD